MADEYEQDDPLSTYSVKLSARHARHARELGDGNMSKGIKKSIEQTYRQAREPQNAAIGLIVLQRRHRKD